jgi:ribosome biogenesis GTPase
MDLPEATMTPDQAAGIWRGAGYTVLTTSTVTGEGLEELKTRLTGHRSAVVGHSGVGKTSMLRMIDPGYLAAVQEVSTFTERGRHTTTTIRSHMLSFGGEVYDMPGLKELDFMSLEKAELGDCYPDFTPFRSLCRFSNCSHTHEVSCEVRKAALEKRLHPIRYENYLQIFDSLPA